MTRQILLIVFALFLLPQVAFAQANPQVMYEGHPAAADSCIIEFDETVLVINVERALTDAGYQLRRVSLFDGSRVPAIELHQLKGYHGEDVTFGVVALDPQRDLDQQLTELEHVSGVYAAWPNYLHHLNFTPNDPYFNGYQGNFRQIYLPGAWDMSTGSGATVAVIDTGYRKSGLEDGVKNLLTGYDFWGNDNNVQDYIGHGTHVANTVAERTNNSIGCAGAAFDATILPLKVFPDYDEGAYEQDIIDAIYYATSHDADVINMSLGGGGYVGATNTAISNAVNNEVIVFDASGNDGINGVEYPGAYSDCIAVGAVKQHSVGGTPVRANFSNYGSALDLVAPGVEIVQETYDSYSGSTDYYAYDGTSSATPHAAAVAALLVANGGADATAIRDAMESTAYNPNGSWTNQLGNGEVDAKAALIAYGGSVSNEPPVADASASPKSGSAPLNVQFDGSDSYDPDGSIQSYTWTDTSSSKIIGSTTKFNYTFSSAGTYTIKLKVVDNDGGSDTDTVTITVTGGGSDDDDDDDDDANFGDDPCGTMLSTMYSDCDLAFRYSNNQLVSGAEAYTLCLEDEDAAPWPCLLACHDVVQSCSQFEECARSECEVDVTADEEDSGDDDDDDDDGFGCN